MKEAFFSKEAMEYLQSIYPHVNKSMFNGLLNMYGLKSNNKITDKSWCSHIVETRYSLVIPKEVSEELGIANEITFPETVNVLYHVPSNNIDVVDALSYACEHMVEQGDEPLLVIELENETAVPKVIYKGKEIRLKRHIYFDWTTRTGEPTEGGLTYIVEHYEREEHPAVNRIERRVEGHAFK
ncbi:hypothetical protein J32TS6_19080 [Virgibacillus pantothenticus]|uniref:hypothetical protein n=1 Tax=Virgibacillus pantothenticus TaxID=1473 RepID=UPI001B27AB93|nr:hypothetical protein [Virgibacillus pantothenticus]GIP63353.1 hypothetical protein J32TS6_19080 [Virgibacillus pantothenticus]